ncbi:PAS domain S-box-containing protein/diguanylate cyclase (GGDEF) domain-containing protein [Noviherbaspirillum humi]|uniref:PAS domain S-box-containing protein/diguanylate cyclase (GGDEF) domain-containing protein n=1 Tax=Noviherbaspirillum humi TaxID=1688639 RepID=A0A239IY23_9BURK|nr:EAL domain-containing protein [Noviherbaspirillum humi]SNS98676.1 PAS domain S-box-containing protein/diguanylate cyclase (GGDEF) domain-containing protein [Noviherbaspirillum humi]
MHQPDREQNPYDSYAQIVSIIAAMVGLSIIIGWMSGTRVLTSLIPGSWTMKFNSGAGMILLSISLYLIVSYRGRRWAVLAASAAALSSAALGALTLFEYAASVDFGIDQFFAREADPSGVHHPGRMAAIAATLFVLMGGAQWLLARNARSRWVEGLTLVAMFNAMVPAIGYLYGKASLYHIPYYGTMALPSALAMLMLCTGILAARPHSGLMALITNRNAGGVTARRLLPGAILVPLVLDRLQYWGQQVGWFDATLGSVLFTLSTIVLFTILVGWTAFLLTRIDLQRDHAEAALQDSLRDQEQHVQALSDANARLHNEIAVRRQAEDSLFHEHERSEVTLNSIGDGVITTDAHGDVRYLNPAAERMTGWSNAEASGKPIGDVFCIIDAISRQPLERPVEEAMQQNAVRVVTDCLLVNRDGSELAINDSCAPMRDREGRIIGAVLVFHDVSAMRDMSQRMAYLAQHDYLTGLPNRFLLNDRLAQAIALALRHGKRAALMFLDLDRFKHVNDTLGHVIGDLLLKQIAARLKDCVRECDTVSRQGGDEFVILLQEVADTIGAARVAAHILEAIGKPYFIDDHEIHISGSIGISICPEDGEDSETIIKHADAAMYQAKAEGRNNYQFFTRNISERAIKRFAMEGNLRRAIARDESALYYQPKIEIATGRVIGAEALLRWQLQSSEIISPAQFIPVAEESGLIIPIGEWVLRQACRQNRAWQEAGYPAMPVAVNVSAVQFRDKHFLELVSRVLQETGLDPSNLELELTESVTMQEVDTTIGLMRSIKDMGISLSIDDFGTGYSSFSYLRRLPIDTLKIDKSFVQDIATDPDGAAIVSAIISMAKILKQKVIAEGVETPAQYEFLRQQGCDQIQGYYFSEPLPAEEFEARFLREQVAGMAQAERLIGGGARH